MTKPSKLYQQLLANPGTIISFRDFERLVDAFGWEAGARRAATGIMLILTCLRS